MRRSALSLSFPVVSLLDVIKHHRHTVTKRPSSVPAPPSCRVVLTNVSNAYENLAVEEALLRGLPLAKGESLLLLYINEPCVVVGRNQNILSEVALRRAREDHVLVVRRSSGGGAVYHDRGNACLSFFTHRADYAPERSIQVLRYGLAASCGIDPQRLTTTTRHDLFLDGKKITGSAMRVQRTTAFHHCTLLVNSCMGRLGRYLHGEGDYHAFRSSSVASVRSPVTTLAAEGHAVAGRDGVLRVLHGLSAFFCGAGGAIMGHPAPWDVPLATWQSMAPRTLEGSCFTLDVVGALAAQCPMLESEGNSPPRGASMTLSDEVVRLASNEWRWSMPRFETEVTVSLAELCSAIVSDRSWTDLVRQVGVQEELLLNQLTAVVLQPSRGEMLVLGTVVENRTIRKATVRHSEDGCDANGSSWVDWFQPCWAALLEGCLCDAAVEGVEVSGDASAWVQGLRLEGGTRVEDLAIPHALLDQCLLMLLRSTLWCWRRKNVFDIA